MTGVRGRRYPAIDLSGAVVVITGGGRGIGKATGAAFAARGATVSLGDIDEQAARGAAREVGRGARAYRVDVTSRGSFSAFIDAVLAELGGVDVLVNNAGVMPLGGFVDEADEISRAALDVNVWGPMHGMRITLPHMTVRGRGHVVTVASMAGKIPIPGMASYNASKYAAVGLTAALRREYAGSGVSISAVLPSAVRTELASGVPLGKGLPTVDPEAVAEAVVRSCRTRKAEIPVPRYLGGWDLLAALTPEPVMRVLRGLIGDDRALTSVDPAGRAAYERRVARQAATSGEEPPPGRSRARHPTSN
ncbi:SDR family oxidoreductase [Haloechinothrix sp. YIM 98757]|uniref:SDR family oxidoreductase n=1 Tax=Haloechinothrix aidingensis TaxID=2752311 RepID=A0A838ADM6_9PSEU|nr:SDR family oxidoreductase [Haloechinothrix aidingensis]MBA0127323.1 SDR family oxidoreductase [Haloechinothrix aidingensis]